jgi:hypothetical protein
MDTSAFQNFLAQFPLPAFSSPGEKAKVTVMGVTYTIISRPKPATVGGLKDFAVFNDLPRELKAKIWGYATEARVVTVVELPKPEHPDNRVIVHLPSDDSEEDGVKDTDPNDAFELFGAGYPSIFEVCKEVKELATAIGYKPMFQLRGINSKMVYFNPEIDILNIATEPMRLGYAKQVALSEALVNKHELSTIRNVDASLSALFTEFDTFVKDIDCMPLLQNLTLLGECNVGPARPAFTLKLNYYYDKEKDKAIPVTPMPYRPVTGRYLVVSLDMMCS